MSCVEYFPSCVLHASYQECSGVKKIKNEENDFVWIWEYEMKNSMEKKVPPCI